MANKLSIPSVVAVNTEGMPIGTVMFLQSVEDALKTLDRDTLFKGEITVNVPPPFITAKAAEGHAWNISGVIVASGQDYAALVDDFQALLQSHLQLQRVVELLVEQLKGT